MIARRELLKWAVSGLGAVMRPTSAAIAAAADAPPSPPPAAFDSNVVVERARDLARKPHEPRATTLPAPFSALTYDQYVGIRMKAGGAVWASDNTGFMLEPLHRGFLFAASMDINVVENGAVRRLTYSMNAFDFGKLAVAPGIPDLGFSGFRVLRAREGRDPAEVALFQGASFFRSLAYGQNYGIVARGLMIRTADPRGEEFPAFREVWIEKPSLANDVLVLHALLDSESMTGAYRFTLRPGDVTITDTECTLFTRTPADFYGLGGMTGMFLFGAEGRRNADDIRSGVYETSGLQILNGNGEWLWRPVTNPAGLQVSAFVDASPRGFGLLQRERNFNLLQDDDQRWELRPSLWIEPINDWGEGSVQLIEVPSDSEFNDNILCFWRPKAVLQAGAEAAFAYRQFWCWTPPDRPPQAVVTDTRSGRGSAPKRRRFLVEFTSDAFADPQRSQDIKPNLSASVGNVTSIRQFLSKERKTLRVLFELDFGGEGVAELRLVLQAAGKPVSETWLYRWTA